MSSGCSRTSAVVVMFAPFLARSSPHLPRRLHDQPELVDLLLVGDQVALDRRREAALRREAELVHVDVPRGFLDAALELVLRLELAALGGHEPEHHELALRDEAQRLETARASVVVLEEEAVHAELAEEGLRDEVI